MNSIDEIMSLIDWNRSPTEQQMGINLATNVKCIKVFFQPQGENFGKSVWENCAIIVSKRSDQELNPYIFDMLLWLQDLNWPGSEIIQQRLIHFGDISMLTMWLNDLVPALQKLNMQSWLYFISPLVQNASLTKQLNRDVLSILYTSQQI